MFLDTMLGKRKPAKNEAKIVFNKVVYPCLNADELLSSEEHAKLFTKLTKLVNLPADYHQTLYLDLINHFANFVQILPIHNEARLASMLNHGIQRAVYALEMHRDRSDDPHNHLMTYTIFSAALLFEIGKAVDDRKISICNQEGKFIADWCPFQGAITEKGRFYKVREVSDMSNKYHLHITPMLARQIMPDVGFHWIAEHPKMLHAWLDMLAGKEPSTIGFSYILEIVKVWQQTNLEGQGFFYPDLELESTEPAETNAGERFLAWLKEGLADGSIKTNGHDAMAHMTAEGLFLEAPAIFEKFSSENRKHPSATVVAAQFNAIGVTKLSGDDVKFDQYYSENPNAAKGASGAHLRKGVFGATSDTAAKTSQISDRFQASQAKATASARMMKEGLIMRNPEIAFGTSPIPPVSSLLKPVALDASLPVMQQILASRNPLPPLFSEPSTAPVPQPTMMDQQGK